MVKLSSNATLVGADLYGLLEEVKDTVGAGDVKMSDTIEDVKINFARLTGGKSAEEFLAFAGRERNLSNYRLLWCLSVKKANAEESKREPKASTSGENMGVNQLDQRDETKGKRGAETRGNETSGEIPAKKKKVEDNAYESVAEEFARRTEVEKLERLKELAWQNESVTTVIQALNSLEKCARENNSKDHSNYQKLLFATTWNRSSHDVCALIREVLGSFGDGFSQKLDKALEKTKANTSKEDVFKNYSSDDRVYTWD